jgi:SAM-dependent methyltransferase
MKSYATFGLGRSLRQMRYAFGQRSRAAANMARLYATVRRDEQRIAHKLGRPVRDLRILEIGPGQGMERACYFGVHNQVVGLDLDVIPRGFDVPGYVHVIQKNGFGRLAKTIGRKVILAPSNRAAWEQVVGTRPMPYPSMIYGDICRAALDPESFDLILSWSVFEHLPDPEQALKNIIDALRPGGIFYLSLHLYTSHSGHHDIRAFTGLEEQLPLWAHLRPSQRNHIHPSAYLNEWRLSQWRRLMAGLAPGSTEYLESYDNWTKFGPRLVPSVRQELAEYSDEELFTVDAIYLFQKTAAQA